MVSWTALAGTSIPVAADTWGISGPAFLELYLLAGVLAVIYGFTQRARIIRVAGEVPVASSALTPAETAMLFDDRRPVLAALAQLRGHQLIDSSGAPIRTPGEVENAALEPVSRTLYAHLRVSDQRHVSALAAAARGSVQGLRTSLAKRGFMTGADQRKEFFLAALPLFTVLLLGLARVIAGIANHRSVVYLILTMIGLVFFTLLVMRPGRLTRRGRTAVNDAVRRNSHLSPAHRPAYNSYGPDSAALATALFGAMVLWSLDPELAGATGTLALGGLSGSGGSCSSSDGGGSDGGGGGGGCGSSCGGGGCGGGCGG
ncbi:TIGR04222 domain-containing membrane protein [Nocardia sp. NPDC051030]|uniref:TIGR04222 domain-containing membrane protein n=1 Tax=Nocardia sp. NPDC051030 TaxID=3155162 RepID=UPI00342CF3BD